MSEIIIATIMRPSGDTGVQTHFNCFRAYLDARQIPQQLITPFSYQPLIVYPVFAARKILGKFSGALNVWWYRYWHAYFLQRALKRQLQSGEDCVIYAQCPLSAGAALSARVSPKQRVVMVTHFNISQADEWAGKGLIQEGSPLYLSIQAFEATVLPQLDGLVFVSDYMQQMLTRRIPAVAAVASVVVPNFLPDPQHPLSATAPASPKAPNVGDPLPAYPIKQDRLSMQTEGGVKGNAHEAPSTDLISIGTLEARKNQQYLLEIIAALKEQGYPMTLTIVGDGPDRQMLEAKALRLQIEDLTTFAGFVSNASELINLHKAYIHVAKLESFGITLIEAMARGKPVFAAAVGGIPEVLGDYTAGLALPLNDAHAAARIIANAMNNQQWMIDAGSAGRERFLKNYASDVAAKRLTEFLGGLS